MTATSLPFFETIAPRSHVFDGSAAGPFGSTIAINGAGTKEQRAKKQKTFSIPIGRMALAFATFSTKAIGHVRANQKSIPAGMAAGFAVRGVALLFGATATTLTAPFTLTGAAVLMAAGAASGIARARFSKDEKAREGRWILRSAFKGALGGWVGGAALESVRTLASLGVFDTVKPVIAQAGVHLSSAAKDTASSFAEEAKTALSPIASLWKSAQGFFAAVAGNDVAPAAPPTVANIEPPAWTSAPSHTFDWSPEQSASVDERPILNAASHPSVAEPSSAADVAAAPPTAEPVRIRPDGVKIARLPVPEVLEDALPKEMFNKLPASMQMEATRAFKSGNQAAIVHSLKEMSFVLMNQMDGNKAAFEKGAAMLAEGAERAMSAGLIETKDGARLWRDYGDILLTGRGANMDDAHERVTRGIAALLLADQKDAQVRKLLAFAQNVHPSAFAEVRADLTEDMVKAIKATPLRPEDLRNAASGPVAAL